MSDAMTPAQRVPAAALPWEGDRTELLITSLELGHAVSLIAKASCLSARLHRAAATSRSQAEGVHPRADEARRDEIELGATLGALAAFPLSSPVLRARLHASCVLWTQTQGTCPPNRQATAAAAVRAGEQLFDVLEQLMDQYFAVMSRLR